MDFHLRAHSVSVDDDTREYAREKIGGAVHQVLGKEGTRVDVEVASLNHGHGVPTHRVSVHVFVPHGKTPVVTVEDGEIRAAIDIAADKIWRVVKELQQKRRVRGRHSGGNGTTPFVGSNL